MRIASPASISPPRTGLNAQRLGQFGRFALRTANHIDSGHFADFLLRKDIQHQRTVTQYLPDGVK